MARGRSARALAKAEQKKDSAADAPTPAEPTKRPKCNPSASENMPSAARGSVAGAGADSSESVHS